MEKTSGRKRQLSEVSMKSGKRSQSEGNLTIARPGNVTSQTLMSEKSDGRNTTPSNLHPHEFLIRLLRDRGIVVDSKPFDSCGFLVGPSPESIEGYKFDVIDAVRSANLEKVKTLYDQGRTLNCSNQFGESLLHMACRKQNFSIVRFMVEVASVPLTLCDDFGRTPLHDACWTPQPNFELVDFLVSRCPDLLFIKDKRGHSPLFYARRDHWDTWIAHLSEGRIDIKPKLIELGEGDLFVSHDLRQQR